MVIVTQCARQPLESEILRAMFEARKRVFVELLKWDVPVIDGRFELDQFDDPHCSYLIVTNAAGDHLGSARLLPTIRPHILDTLFPDLVAGAVPAGPRILEITRFCLSRNQNASERLETRNRLVSALVAYYTGVAELSWLQQILAFGWHCRPLGLPRQYDGALLGALRIDISKETPALLHQGRIWTPEALTQTGVLEAA